MSWTNGRVREAILGLKVEQIVNKRKIVKTVVVIWMTNVSSIAFHQCGRNILNTRHSVSSGYLNTEKWVKKTRQIISFLILQGFCIIGLFERSLLKLINNSVNTNHFVSKDQFCDYSGLVSILLKYSLLYSEPRVPNPASFSLMSLIPLHLVVDMTAQELQTELSINF